MGKSGGVGSEMVTVGYICVYMYIFLDMVILDGFFK